MPVNRYYSSTAKTTTLSAGATSSAVNISVGSVSGFPTSYPYTLVIDEDTLQEEIVEVSAAAGTTLTVTRGIDGSLAQAHAAGARVRHHVSARDFRESQEHIAASAAVHGLAGSVVGTSDTQTLTNKTLTSPVVTGATVDATSLTLPQSAAPTPTAEGQVAWDTDDNKLKIGDGATTKVFSDDSVASGVHGVTGSVVGTTDTQVLTNKTLTAPTIGDLTNAGHTHAGAASGGNIPQSSVTSLVADLALKAPLAGPTFTGTTTAATLNATAYQKGGVAVLPPITCTSGTRPTGAAGQVIFETDTGEFLVYTTATTGWRRPWSTAWGQLAHFTSASTVGVGISTAVDLTGMNSGALTLPANRRVRVSAQLRTTQSAVASIQELFLVDSVAGTIAKSTRNVGASENDTITVSVVVTPASGAHTYKVQLSTTSGTVDTVAGAAQPIWLLVEDIGPAGAPA